MNIFVELLKEQEQFSSILDSLKSKASPIRITGTCETQKVHLAFSLCHELSKSMLYVVPDALTAKFVYEDLKFFAQDNVRYYPAMDIVFHKVDAKSNESANARIKVLNDILNTDTLFVVTTIQALAQKTINVSKFRQSLITVKNGDILQPEELVTKLSNLGYKREANVESPGQFSVRGGILDIYPCNSMHPYRIEFWDEEVDTIKIFDEDTQLSTDKAEKVVIPPLNDVLEGYSSTICDYFDNYLVFYDEPHRIEEYYNVAVKELSERISDALNSNTYLNGKASKTAYYLQDYNELDRKSVV